MLKNRITSTHVSPPFLESTPLNLAATPTDALRRQLANGRAIGDGSSFTYTEYLPSLGQRAATHKHVHELILTTFPAFMLKVAKRISHALGIPLSSILMVYDTNNGVSLHRGNVLLARKLTGNKRFGE